MELPPRRKRQPRKLDYFKCTFCRKAKIKCNPANRTWPTKCERCESKNLPCSAPARKAQSAETPPQDQSSVMGGVVQSSAMDSGGSSQTSTEEVLDLLSLRCIFGIAVEELHLIGETYLATIKHDQCYDRYLIQLNYMIEPYNQLHQFIDHKLDMILEHLSFSGAKEIVRAMSFLSCLPQLLLVHVLDYAKREHHGMASILMMRYLFAHPGNDLDFSREFSDSWRAFLERWQEVFHKFKIDRSPAYLELQEMGCNLLETQLVLPRHLVRVPKILEEVRKNGRKDYIGRPIPFIEHDADLPWSFDNVTNAQRDILRRSRAHIFCFDGQLLFEVTLEELAQKLNEEDLCGKTQFLSSHYAYGVSPLSLAAMKGQLDVFQELHHAMPALMSRSFQAEASPITRRNSLHWAASCGQMEIVRFLCSNYQAELPYGGQDNLGMTAIHLAARSNHIQVVQYLLEYIISTAPRGQAAETIGCIDLDDCTAFWCAAKQGHVDILRLLQPYADTNRRDIMRRTPLHIASRKGHTEVVQYLLDLPIGPRPDVNAVDYFGKTPLQCANDSGNFDCVKLLHEHGAFTGHELQNLMNNV